jgi:hypothetical protein
MIQQLPRSYKNSALESVFPSSHRLFPIEPEQAPTTPARALHGPATRFTDPWGPGGPWWTARVDGARVPQQTRHAA